jgi:hypothetical protein
MFPEFPEMMMVPEPAGAVLAAVRVRVVVLLVVGELKLAVTPVARPLTEKVTGPLKLLSPVIAMVLLWLVPCTMV